MLGKRRDWKTFSTHLDPMLLLRFLFLISLTGMSTDSFNRWIEELTLSDVTSSALTVNHLFLLLHLNYAKHVAHLNWDFILLSFYHLSFLFTWWTSIILQFSNNFTFPRPVYIAFLSTWHNYLEYRCSLEMNQSFCFLVILIPDVCKSISFFFHLQ